MLSTSISPRRGSRSCRPGSLVTSEVGQARGLRTAHSSASSLRRGGVFGPLENVEFFRQVQVDSEAGTIVWPNGVDFCPDVLYSLATGKPIRVLEHA
jgi:hypothetical protein